MNFITRSKILISSYLKRNEIKKLHDLNKEVSIAKYVSMFGKQPNTGSYPMPQIYSSIRDKHIKNIEIFAKQNLKNQLVIVGDSLSDFTRQYLSSCHTELNLSLAGQASSYYINILNDTFEALKKVDVKYLMIECWGNELLNYYELETVKQHVTETVKIARILYPNVKLILGGLPPVYDLYTNSVKIEFTKHLLDIANNDSNCTLILFEKHFSGMFGVFPKVDYSSDGVHFSGNGIILYDNLINRAKESKDKVIGV